MPIPIFEEAQIRKAVSMNEAITAMEEAFASYSLKTATVPGVIHLDVPERRGEIHIKAGHIHRTSEYVIKVAAGFWENRNQGLPVSSGLMMVFSAETGFPLALLLDNGYLTELRTAAAGAVAAKYMALPEVEQVAILGAGAQGRFQLESISCVRSFRRVLVYDHHASNVEKYLAEMKGKCDAEIRPAATPEDAIRGSRIVVTCTPSRTPFVRGEWIEPGTHITAMGSDDPTKQELHISVLQRADRIIADSLAQCLVLGEIHHAVGAGVIKKEDVDGELGAVVSGRIPGRVSDQEITVCDLTGVGVQDARIAQLVYKKVMSNE